MALCALVRAWNRSASSSRNGNIPAPWNQLALPRNFSPALMPPVPRFRHFPLVPWMPPSPAAGRIYFGELTCTPAAGLSPLASQFRLAQRTDMWELAADNELLYQRKC